VRWLIRLSVNNNRYFLKSSPSSATMFPVVFLSHGAGPAWFVDGSQPGFSRLKELDQNSESANFMRNLRSIAGLPRNPDAILVVSAHWEEDELSVLSSERPTLYYDYGNFPEHTFHLKWPVPGAFKAAERTKALLNKAGFKCNMDEKRGLDHGVFVPLMLAYPEADVPVFQLSLKSGLSIPEHLAIGEALQDLRKENILIVGSGQSTHNDSQMCESKVVPSWCPQFREWFHDALTNKAYTPEQRKKILLESELEATFAVAHPRIEHYLPSIIAAAVAGYKPGEVLFDEIVESSMLMSTVKFP